MKLKTLPELLAQWDSDEGNTTNEIQGAAIMRENGISLYFLPRYGFANPEAILEA